MSIERSDIGKDYSYIDRFQVISIDHYQPVNSKRYLNNI